MRFSLLPFRFSWFEWEKDGAWIHQTAYDDPGNEVAIPRRDVSACKSCPIKREPLTRVINRIHQFQLA